MPGCFQSLIGGFALIVIVSIWALVADHTMKPPVISSELSEIVVREDVARGDTVCLDASFYAIDDESMEKMLRFYAADDKQGLLNLSRNRKIFAVENNIKAIVTEAGVVNHSVRLSEGLNRGAEILCPVGMAHKSLE